MTHRRRGVGAEGGADVRWRRRSAFRAMPGDLHARAAAGVVKPELRSLVRDDVLAVRSPDRRHVAVTPRVGKLAGAGPVGVGHPQVFGTVAVADEHDFGPVGRVARLHVVALPTRDACRGAAPDGEGVEIAEQLEGDGLAVGRQVERDPGAFVRREVERPGRDQRQGVAPLGRPRRAVVLLGGLGRDGLRDEGGRRQSAHQPARAPRAARRRAHGSGRARGGHATGPGIDPKRNHARHRSPPWTPPQRLVQIRMVPQKVPPPWYSGGRPLTVA